MPLLFQIFSEIKASSLLTLYIPLKKSSLDIITFLVFTFQIRHLQEFGHRMLALGWFSGWMYGGGRLHGWPSLKDFKPRIKGVVPTIHPSMPIRALKLSKKWYVDPAAVLVVVAILKMTTTITLLTPFLLMLLLLYKCWNLSTFGPQQQPCQWVFEFVSSLFLQGKVPTNRM